jgi:peroxiredoxin
VTGQRFPVLLDRSAKVAEAYGVESLPTVCVIDEDGIVRYRGAFDDNRREDMVKNHYCRDAIQRLSRMEVTATAFYTGLR